MALVAHTQSSQALVKRPRIPTHKGAAMEDAVYGDDDDYCNGCEVCNPNEVTKKIDMTSNAQLMSLLGKEKK